MNNESGHQTIVLNCQTKRLAQDVGGRGNIADMGLSVVTIGRPTTDGNDELFNRLYLPDKHLDREYSNICFGEVQHVMDWADTVVTFGGDSFDFTLLEAEGFDVTNCRYASYDILTEYHRYHGRRIRSDDLSKKILGEEKQIDRSDTVHLWKGIESLRIVDGISRAFNKNAWLLSMRMDSLSGAIANIENDEIIRMMNLVQKLPISASYNFNVPVSKLITEIITISRENTRRAWELYKRRDEIMRVS